MNLDNVKQVYKDQLLRFFMYYMPMDQREKLMTELPAAYNAVCEREIVKVVRVSDGKPV
jgi:NAD/NADP transhydrogenase alpha subunit